MNWIQTSQQNPPNIAPVLVCYLEATGPSYFLAMFQGTKWFRAIVEHGMIKNDFHELPSPDFWVEVKPPKPNN